MTPTERHTAEAFLGLCLIGHVALIVWLIWGLP